MNCHDNDTSVNRFLRLYKNRHFPGNSYRSKSPYAPPPTGPIYLHSRRFRNFRVMERQCCARYLHLPIPSNFPSVSTNSSFPGDKDNHVASIHLPQMLYIWSFIAFFSFPLLYPFILGALLPRSLIPTTLHVPSSNLVLLPRLRITIPILAAMLTAVHYNTVVHPFTLADNRHYTFYVFRILVLRHVATKYLAVPVYFLCGWAAIVALAGFSDDERKATGDEKDSRKEPMPEIDRPTRDSASQRTNLVRPAGHAPSPPSPRIQQSTGPRTSFIIVYLLSTTLSLITAPLVEPRYWIIPWLIWRLHLPIPQSPHPFSPLLTGKVATGSGTDTSHRRLFVFNVYVETVWFLVVNFVTGWIFLKRGFEWVGEGNEGAVQRFMW